MVGKLVNHPLPVKFVFRSMMQNMQANEAFEQILMLYLRHDCPGGF